MATFRFSRAINLHWQGYEIKGPALTVFSIPDQLYEEFNADIAPVEPSLVWIDTNEFLTLQNSFQAGGVASVSGTSPITTSGTTAITVGIISASTTSAGVVILSDSTSTTSSVLAATPTAVKSAYDQGSTGVTNAATAQATADAAVSSTNYEFSQFGTSGITANLPRYVLTLSSSPSSGMIVHNKITPHKTITISNIAMVTGATSAGVLTVARMGIYTRSGTTFTLVARTASDVTLFQGAATKYTRALDTTGGYPATYTMTAGTEYFISSIQISTTVAPFLSATARNSSAGNAATGVQQYSQTGQSDLVTSSTGSAQLTAGGNYAEVS